MTLVEKADQLAERAHADQTRKGSDEPYITHPRAVAAMLQERGFSDEVVAAALVHDVVEDTVVSIEDVRRELGSEVTQLVAPVTHDDSLPWEEKKRKYIETVRQASPDAKAIATADKIHNAQSLLAAYRTEGASVWKHFNRGKDKKLWFERAMLAMLRESWNDPMVEEYAALVDQLARLDG